jgi:hypothetical protein
MEPEQPPKSYDLRNSPAWPLGCATAFFGLLLIVNLLGLGGIVFAASGLPLWAQRGGPVLMAVMVPTLMLVGGLLARRRNAYGSRVLLWACGLTMVSCGLITLVLNFIDRQVGA